MRTFAADMKCGILISGLLLLGIVARAQTDDPTDGGQLNGVTVTSAARKSMDKIESAQIGVEKISIAEMAKLPSLLGERDIVKALQLLPGVKSDGDGSAGFQVRGGTASQNHILFDDATVYNAGHLMGFFSTFNDDALQNASLYKGQIPAQFGGGTSSVFDVNTKDGSMERLGGSGSIGLLSAKLNVEGPIVSDRLSFYVAARRTYFDQFLKLTDKFKNTTLYFYDLNAKLNWRIGGRDRLFVSLFNGRDKMGLENMMMMDWGNFTTDVRWVHQLGDGFYSNTSLFGSRFSTDNSLNVLEQDRSFGGHIRHNGVKQSFVQRVSPRLELRYGLQAQYIDLVSAEWNMHVVPERDRHTAWETDVWLNGEWKPTRRLTLLGGLRMNQLRHYVTPEPRLSLSFRTSPLSSIKVGYSATSQHIHALRSGKMSLPFDRYTLSSDSIKPQRAHQVSLGYAMLTRNQAYEFSVEGYYKTIRNVLDYKDGKTFSSDIDIERLVLAGRGRAYGLECYVRKNAGALTGWVSYTLSWSENKIPGINQGRWYTATNDRRHDLSVVAMYAPGGKWEFAAAWVYNTGQALTAPSGKYELNGETLYYYAERSGYRAPAYHRLDLSATLRQRRGEWVFGIYNAYNHYNPFIISFENDDTKASGTKAVQQSLFGMVPSVTYNFHF